MQTFSQNAALLIIDVQNGFDEPCWGRRNNPEMEARIVELLDAWRASKRPVIHAKHMSVDPASPLRPGQAGNDFKIRMTPLPGEYVVEKRVNSCFIGTALEAELRRRCHDTLVIVGMTTNHCVSTTYSPGMGVIRTLNSLPDCPGRSGEIGSTDMCLA